MGKALYRTYRSKKLAEIVGQEHITETLDNALKKGLISHAYLFTGPRGVGKTSIARILAHEINELPYTDEQTHLDIIEIDAASNRRIDEIRDLRDKVHNAPASAKFKVYIIDEVHMLTREAFNALLKTLEEPPAHAIFILATTEIHKLPETIISRTQRFAFRPVTHDKVVAHLRHITKQEKITIDDDALALIAAHGEGSFRDSISLLDQAGSTGLPVTKATIEQMLGIAPAEQIKTLVEALRVHNSQTIVTILQQFVGQGSSAALVAKQLGKQLRQDLLDGTLSKDETIIILEKLLEVPSSSNPFIFLEIILLNATLHSAALPQPAKHAPHPQSTTPSPGKGTAAKPRHTNMAALKKTKTLHVEAKAAEAPVPTGENQDTTAKTQTPTDGVTLTLANWSDVLQSVKKDHNTLFSILRSAEPSFSPGIITLTFGFAFHQKRINAKQNKETIAGLVKVITGENIIIRCILGTKKPTSDAPELPPASLGEQVHAVPSTHDTEATQADTPPANDAPEDYYVKQAEAEASARPLTAISNIFGGGELLES